MVATYIIGKDPDWERAESERWGRAITTLLAMKEREREQRDREFARDMAMLQSDPQLATTAYGQDMIDKYPDKANFIQRMAEIGANAKKGEAALGKFYEQSSAIQAQRAAERKMAMAVPQLAQNFGMPFSPEAVQQKTQETVTMQGIENAMAGSPEYEAYMGMPHADRYFAGQQMRRDKIPLPKGPDLDPGQNIESMLATGASPEQIIESVNIKSGRKLSAQQAAMVSDREAGRTAATTRQTTQFENAKRLEAIRQSNREKTIKYRADHGGAGSSKGDVDEFARALDGFAEKTAAQDLAAKKDPQGLTQAPKVSEVPPPEARAEVAQLVGLAGKSGYNNAAIVWNEWVAINTDPDFRKFLTPEERVIAWTQRVSEMAGLLPSGQRATPATPKTTP